MSRIIAGNTLVNNLLNQYTPPFSVSESVASGWHLRWNDTLKAFEAYDPEALKGDGGFDAILVDGPFPASGVSVNFPVNFIVPDEESLIITINGVKQQTGAYTILETFETSMVVQFVEAPQAGDLIEFLGLQARNPTDIRTFDSTGDQGPQWTIPWLAPSPQSLILTINGVKQQSNAYEISYPGGVNGSTTTLVTLLGEVLSGYANGSKTAGGITFTSASLNFQTAGVTTNDILRIYTGSEAGDYIIQSASGSTVTIANGNGFNQLTGWLSSETGLIFSVFKKTLTSDDQIEILGILDTGEAPSSPLDGINLGAGAVYGIFDGVDVAGVKQVARFKSLAAGNNITITENVGGEFYTISAGLPDYTNIGSGQGVVVNPSADTIEFRTITGDGDQISVAPVNGTLVVSFAGDATTLGGTAATSFATTVADAVSATGESLVAKGTAANDNTLRLKGIRGGAGGITVTDLGDDLYISSTTGRSYREVTGTTYSATFDEEILGVQNVAAVTINLPEPASVPVGHRVIIKDEAGGDRTTSAITIQTALSAGIDSGTSTTIGENFGFVELYSNGSQYFILGRRG
jgi:hypothetical protein